MASPPPFLDPRDEREVVQRALRDWLAFQQALALHPVEALAALRHHGDDPRAALRSRRPRSPRNAPSLDAALGALADAGAVLVPVSSPAYPWRLAQLPDPAPVLAVTGEVGVLSSPCVALVGARAATAYGRAVARALAADLARAGIVVVSGLARGIDASAHLGALEVGGRTVAVQGCGPDQVYPAAHRDLARRIASSGALLSELPPGTPPRGPHFPLRNRLISGLSRALVVVEARHRSGSLVTARHAFDQGIDVFAVPGPISSPASAGTNRLLRDGAYVALEAADILSELGLPRHRRRAAPQASPDSPIVRLLEDAPRTRDELARALGQPPPRIALALLELELEGRVVEDRDGRLRAVPRELS